MLGTILGIRNRAVSKMQKSPPLGSLVRGASLLGGNGQQKIIKDQVCQMMKRAIERNKVGRGRRHGQAGVHSRGQRPRFWVPLGEIDPRGERSPFVG